MLKEYRVAVALLVLYFLSLIAVGTLSQLYIGHTHARKCRDLRDQWEQAINASSFSWRVVQEAQDAFIEEGCFE